MNKTTNLELTQITKNDKIWDSIEALNDNMLIIDNTFGEALEILSTVVGGDA